MSFLGFADLEEKFQEVFERFETLEKDELSCPVTSETSIEEEEPVRCDAEKEHNLDFFCYLKNLSTNNLILPVD